MVEMLEEVEDFTAMLDVLAFYSGSQDSQVLATVALTTVHFFDIFVAIGAADTLFVRIFEQYAELDDKSSLRSLMEALIDLGQMLPSRSSEVRTLEAEFQKLESKLGVAACSPISEHMAEALHFENPDAASTSIDDIEQLLASGTSMDKPLVMSIFGLIWKRFETSWTDSIKSSVASASLITRLRSFNTTAVDEMTALRVDQVLVPGSRPKLMRIWIPLVCARTISLVELLSRSLNFLHRSDNPIAYSELSVEIIELLSSPRQKATSSISHVGLMA